MRLDSTSQEQGEGTSLAVVVDPGQCEITSQCDPSMCWNERSTFDQFTEDMTQHTHEPGLNEYENKRRIKKESQRKEKPRLWWKNTAYRHGKVSCRSFRHTNNLHKPLIKV